MFLLEKYHDFPLPSAIPIIFKQGTFSHFSYVYLLLKSGYSLWLDISMYLARENIYTVS